MVSRGWAFKAVCMKIQRAGHIALLVQLLILLIALLIQRAGHIAQLVRNEAGSLEKRPQQGYSSGVLPQGPKEMY